jgi:hypothetical protein
VIVRRKECQNFRLDSASDHKIEAIMQNIIGNIQEHYHKEMCPKEIGGRSRRD